MTEREIRKYIDRLNNKKGQESIFTRPISETVDVGKVWREQPKQKDSVSSFSSSRFFFIKNTLGVYVGAVLDMDYDLHWYVLPKQRKKGILTKSLKETILPYLFYERKEQRITIENGRGVREKNYNNSLKVALNLGFKPINKEQTKFILKKSEFDWSVENLNEEDNLIEEDRIKILKKRINYASKILLKISDELLMSYANDKELLEVSRKVKDYTWKIEDLMWEYRKNE
ncbi:hypothetical protein [Algibacter sp. 2305UL17-15]|uniref:hypothetical protein n=1 Tax=Algibacter sp. 2305UL17-15 TaxID=3231268 RepID=UPI003457E39E